LERVDAWAQGRNSSTLIDMSHISKKLNVYFGCVYIRTYILNLPLPRN